jgi:hypothetical protein
MVMKELTDARIEAIAKDIYESESHWISWAKIPKSSKQRILKYVRMALEADRKDV